jgi:hypothetical protein
MPNYNSSNMPIQSNHLDHIKHRLEDIRDMLFDEHIDTSLYSLGYLMRFIDDVIIDSENDDADDPEEDSDRDYEQEQ